VTAVTGAGAADRVGELTAALVALRSRLAAAAVSADRAVEEITLLPITKFFPATDVAILWRLGCRAFGESREQEAVAKIGEFTRLVGGEGQERSRPGPDPDPDAARWHMVGQIQRNKAKSIAAWADTVHSVSTDRVAEALDRAAAEALDAGRRSRPLRVFVQISLDGDTTRGGVDVADHAAVDRICAQIADSRALDLPSRRWAMNTAGSGTPTRKPLSCPPGCQETSKLRCDTVQRVCVSVRRLWANVL
jgi:uncharacterized pyridoxal phosphate-containing UPF0001 family protein